MAFIGVCNSTAYEAIENGAARRAERDRSGFCIVPTWKVEHRRVLIALCDDTDVATLCGNYRGSSLVMPILGLLSYRGCIAIGEFGPVVTAHGWRVVERLMEREAA